MTSFSEQQLYHIEFKGEKEGPLRFEEIRRKYERREIGGLHYLLTQEQKIPLSQVFGHDKKAAALTLSKQRTKPAPSPRQIQEVPQPETPPRKNNARYWLWFENKQQGPFSLKEIQSLLQSGKLGKRTLLWLEHSQSWRKIEDVFPVDDW